MKKNKKLGFILITTLIFMTLTFMLMVMVCKNGKESLFAGNRYAENEQAYLAALSGIEFIKGQLYKDKSWLTDTSAITKYASSSSKTITVEMVNNTLTGYILLDPSKDSVSGTDYNSKFEIFLENNSDNREYKSINNLANSQNIPITINDETKTKNLNKREVPAKTFYAYVKGTCGKTVRYAEALLASSGTTSIDGGSIINGNIVINTTNENDNQYTKENPFITIQNKNNTDGKITASGLLTFENNKINNDEIQIILNSLNKTIINSSNLKIGNFNGTVTSSNEEMTSHIQYNPNPIINLSDLDIENLKISSNQNITDENTESINEDTTKSYTLPAGTYAFINDLEQSNSTNESKWVYTTADVTKDNIDSIIQNDSMTDIKDDENNSAEYIEFVKGENGEQKRTVKIKGNIISNGTLKFIVIDKNNNNKYELSTTNTVDISIEENGAITTTNDLYINGEVTGSGKINCGGDLTMNAGSSLETKAQNGIAIYAEGNINIQEAKNLSSDSKEIESTIITEAIKEAKENIDTSNETEININGEIISLNDGGTTTQDPDELAISFQRTKYYGDGIKSLGYGIYYIDRDWFDLKEQGGDYVRYKIKLKTINNQQNILIYRNDEQAPIFQRSYDELKYQMYSYYNPEESRRAGKIIVHNDMDTPHKVNSSDYWYYDKGITTDKVSIKDYNRAIQGNGSNGHGAPGQNDNYMGDMKLYLDGYCVGIIDINYDKIKSDKTLYNYRTIQKYDNIQKAGISFSETNYKGDMQKCDCFTDFINNHEQGYDNNNGNTNNGNTNNGNSGQNTINTIQEYVQNYYKKKVANTEIKGTIYSKNGSINIEGNSGEFNLTGALITLKGDLKIYNASHITLTYDPDYVPFFKNKGILTTSIFESVF